MKNLLFVFVLLIAICFVLLSCDLFGGSDNSGYNPVSGAKNSLCGEFTVSSSRKVVKFFRGNLYYTGSSWGFEEHQYDFRTCQGSPAVKNGAYSSTETAGENTGLFYWSNDVNVSVSSVYSDPNRTVADLFFPDTNPVIGDEWFTLSYSEWEYLLNSRTNASRKKGLATINTGSYEVRGLVLLPDSWTLPSGCSFTGGVYTIGWKVNVYSASEWSAMETAGAVFLPAAGDRDGSSVNYVQELGGYWSSTPGPSYDGSAGGIYFYSIGGIVMNADFYRYGGKSVRLVTLSRN